MFKRAFLIVVLVLAAAVLMVACQRSASVSPLATPTPGGQISQPTGISLVEAWGTSTAIYQQTAQALLTTPAGEGTPGADQTEVEGTSATATSTFIVVPTATPGRPETYTLETGEFPYCIARRFDVNPADLLALNNLGVGQTLQAGYELRIPQTGYFPGERALRAHPSTYTVAVSDTLYKIACYFGDVDPTSIAAANGITVDAALTTGQVLNIP